MEPSFLFMSTSPNDQPQSSSRQAPHLDTSFDGPLYSGLACVRCDQPLFIGETVCPRCSRHFRRPAPNRRRIPHTKTLRSAWIIRQIERDFCTDIHAPGSHPAALPGPLQVPHPRLEHVTPLRVRHSILIRIAIVLFLLSCLILTVLAALR